MKKFATIILCCLFFQSFAGRTTFDKLCEVNKCWKDQGDVIPSDLPLYQPQSEKEWIRIHLSIVEQVLRGRNMAGLSASQKQNRLQCLDQLHSYWMAGNFPQNEDYAYRTPIFIDKHDNFCAVGYLVKASGHEDVSRMIASKTNLAYVKEMKYPELTAWAVAHGFTTDELAWIQPGYPPSKSCEKIGHGVDGEVSELYVDATSGRLYVGGSFINADSTLVANNVAYVTESSGNYTWHNMGSGVNGKVNAIQSFLGNIFVAGQFTAAGGNMADNVAIWDGSAWHSAGCINGTVSDLIVYKDGLYAAGSFNVCTSSGMPSGFAKWNGNAWQAIPGITGHVNTMQVMGSKLVLGGAIMSGTQNVNAIMWDDVSGFTMFAGNVNNEVMDFEIFKDTLYAACKSTSAADSVNLLVKLAGGSWVSGFKYETEAGNLYGRLGERTFNTMCIDGEILSLGGNFYNMPMIGTMFKNTYGVGYSENMVWVDSEVNKIVIYKNSMILGGKFKTGNNSWSHVTLNGIARRSGTVDAVASIPARSNALVVYPDPVRASGILTVENNINAYHYTLRDMTGRLQASGAINGAVQKINIPALAPGVYLMDVSNGHGEQMTRKVIIE